MALKTARINIKADGRDQGKVFLITEMPARPFERWALKALLAMGKAGMDIPDNIKELGPMALVSLGLQALLKIDFQTADELMDEMFGCIQYAWNPADPSATRPLIETDIEEVTTRLKLRADWWTLMTGFQIAGSQSTSTT